VPGLLSRVVVAVVALPLVLGLVYIGGWALLGLGIAAFYMLLRTWRAGTLEQRLVAVAAGGALLGFSVHNQLDAGNIWKTPVVALAVVGAIIVRNDRERASQPGADSTLLMRLPAPMRRWGAMAVRAALLGLITVPLLAWFRFDRAHHDYYSGMEALTKGDVPKALARVQGAVNSDSSLAVYQLQLGLMQATAYQSGRMQDQRLIDAAIIHLEEARDLDPRSDLVRANLAKAYQLAGRNEDAAREAQIVRLAVHHVPPVLFAGEIYEDMGFEPEAIATYAQVVSMDAGLANSTYWLGTQWRKDHFAEILAASSLSVNPCTFGSYLVDAPVGATPEPERRLADAEEGCKILVVNFPEDLVYRVALARIFRKNGNDLEARVHLDFAVKRQPDFGPAHTELGKWYAARGDESDARHQWVIGGQLEEAESIMLLGDSYPAGQVPAELRDRLGTLLSGTGTSIKNDTISVLYYRLRYGRVSPLLPLVSGDWQNAVPRQYQQMKSTLDRWNREAGIR